MLTNLVLCQQSAPHLETTVDMITRINLIKGIFSGITPTLTDDFSERSKEDSDFESQQKSRGQKQVLEIIEKWWILTKSCVQNFASKMICHTKAWTNSSHLTKYLLCVACWKTPQMFTYPQKNFQQTESLIFSLNLCDTIFVERWRAQQQNIRSRICRIVTACFWNNAAETEAIFLLFRWTYVWFLENTEV